MDASPHKIEQGDIFVYTPEKCIGRALHVFRGGLTFDERAQARKTLRIVANQDRGWVEINQAINADSPSPL